MATTCFFEKKKIRCVGGKDSLEVEIGRTSYYGDNRLYLEVDDKRVVMDEKTAKEFVAAVAAVGHYLNLSED